MKNLFKTLMPYKYTALLVLLLMAGQAFCEMNLPAYTQALIDTGIQNRGIEPIVPEAIEEDEYLEVESRMTADEKALWESAFEKDGNIYRRKDLDDEKLEEMDEALLSPLANRYAELRGETVTGEVSADDANLMAMGIAYAGDCDEAAGLDLLKIQNSFMV